MKIKKACFYLISFLSITVMFSVCYYLSYKNALKQFNENAVERNSELILSLENNGLLNNPQGQVANQAEVDSTNDMISKEQNEESSEYNESSLAVDTVIEDMVLPATKYALQTFDIKTGTMEEEILPAPSYLVGLTRNQVIEYLHDYMLDLTWNEYEKGLTAFELLQFSKDKVVIRKTYNAELVDNKYYLSTQNGYIVVYYGDKKTVFDYTSVSVENLSQYEQIQLEEGIFVKDLDELYAILENYSS